MTAEQLIKRIGRAKDKKLKRQFELQEAYRYVLPTRDESTTTVERGVVFDSTAKNAAEKYATKLQNLLTPAHEEWLKLQPGSDVPEEEKGKFQEQLDKASDIAFSHIHNSNFYTAEHEAFLDLSISTGAIIVERNTRKNEPSVINCRCVPLSQIIPEQTSRGTLDNVFREFNVKISEINSIWSEAKIPQILQEKLSQSEDAECKIYEGVVYNEKDGNFTMYVIDTTTKTIMLEEEMETSPFIVFRETVRPGDALGFGRALRVLEDIKTLNKFAENALRADGIQAMPIFTATDDGAFNPYNVVLQPGSIIPVSSNESANPSLRVLDTSSNGYTMAEKRMDQLRAVINDTFLANPFGSIEQTPVRSATEIAAREADLFQSTAAAFGRLQIEFLYPFMNRVLDILKSEGKLPPMKADGKIVTIKFTSPFAKMQGSEKVKNILQWAGYSFSLGQEVSQLSMNMDKIPGKLAEYMGIDKVLYKDETEIEEDKEKLGQIAAQSMQQGADPTQAASGGQAQPMPIM
jgi:hypothetical protein